MTKQEWDDLKAGDIVRHKNGNGDGYVVADKIAGSIVIARIRTASNPREWDIGYKQPDPNDEHE